MVIVDIDAGSPTRDTVIKEVPIGTGADLLEHARPLLFVSSSVGSITEVDTTSAALKKQFKSVTLWSSPATTRAMESCM